MPDSCRYCFFFLSRMHRGQYHFPFGFVVRPTQAKWNHSIGHYNTNNKFHTHCRFMVLCPGLPRWAGIRRDVHPLTPETCCGSLSSFGILWGMAKIIDASASTMWMDATASGPSMPQPPSFPQFYAAYRCYVYIYTQKWLPPHEWIG